MEIHLKKGTGKVISRRHVYSCREGFVSLHFKELNENMNSEPLDVEKKSRQFLPEDFVVEDWDQIKPYYDNLLDREINSSEELERWFENKSELESVLSESLGWRYIKMTTDTNNQVNRERFNFFISQIEPHTAPFTDKLNKKVIGNPFLEEVADKPGFNILIRSIKNDLQIFREENIPLNTKIQEYSQEYGALFGDMMVGINGKELTLQQAAVLLQSLNRNERKEAFTKIVRRRLEDKEKLDQLFSTLIKLRDEVAQNANFKNYRDYMFSALGRFDYTAEDCFEFHTAVREEVVPVLNEIASKKKEELGLGTLRPWDKAVDSNTDEPLKPFLNTEDLTDKTIDCFNKLDTYLGSRLAIMRKMGHLDLDSRKGKAPGGYNYPLAEVGVPFIFMNATSTLADLVTLLHEGGHAVHSFLIMDLLLNDFKNAPSEIAELASMSMELLTMDYWDIYFDNEEDLKRAKKQHLEQIIETLPWVATIDKFQHWIYENPGHTPEDRRESWLEILESFTDNVTDWSGLEEAKGYLWQKQLHLYEVPFYYIEYAIAQLGAIAVWKNYKENPEQGLKGYIDALKLGYTKSIPEVYKAAGIDFNFSREYIRKLIKFVKTEMDNL